MPEAAFSVGQMDIDPWKKVKAKVILNFIWQESRHSDEW